MFVILLFMLTGSAYVMIIGINFVSVNLVAFVVALKKIFLVAVFKK